MRPHHRIRFPALALAAIASLAAAQSATGPLQPLPRGPGLGDLRHYKGPTLKGAALRRCVAIDTEWRARSGELQQENQNLDAEKSQFERLDRDLDEQERTIDRSDADAIQRFNQRAAQQLAMVKAYNAKLPAYAEHVDRHNELVERFNADCAGRAYLIREWLDADAAQSKQSP